MRHLYAHTIAGLLLIAGTTAAQQQQDREYSLPATAQEGEQARVSDQQLRQFVTARDNVRSVQEEFSEAIQRAESMEQAQTLRNDAQKEMRAAVEDTGLRISDYNTIAERAQFDPKLAQRLQDIRSQ